MSVLILSPDTVWNPALLEFPTAPRKILERGIVLPRREFTWGLAARMVVELQLLRFLTALAPFVLVILIWPGLALPASQAPLIMLMVIAFVELRVLRPRRDRRDAITTEDDAARALDALNHRGRRLLAQLAAGRGMQDGTLFLVVEQSELARIPPLTLVSVQADRGRHRLLPLTPGERDALRAGLFDAEFTESQLLRANLREDVSMRSVTFDARGVSAHARLAALLDRAPGSAGARA